MEKKAVLENGHICVQNGTKLLTWNGFFSFNPLDYINIAIYLLNLIDYYAKNSNIISLIRNAFCFSTYRIKFWTLQYKTNNLG